MFHSPVAVRDNLTPDEQEVIALRRHPIILFSPIVTALGAIIVAAGTSSLPVVEWMKIVVWLLSTWFIGGLIAACKGWYSGFVAVTSRRLILSGPSSGEFETISLTSVADISLRRSVRARLIGYGDLVITVSGKGDRVLAYMPYPQQIYYEISQLTGTVRPFGAPGSAD
jgi:hypothetical protein